MTVIPVDFSPLIAIVTKRKTYFLPPDAVGIPIEDRLGNVPDSLKGLKF